MAKEIFKKIKLQCKGGAANPSPPIGPALGSAGVNIMDFCKQFNARTQDKQGKVLPVQITVYTDKSFDFVIKTPPGSRTADGSRKTEVRFRRTEPQKSGRNHLGSGKNHRRRQDDRPERFHRRKRNVDDSRNGSFNGYNNQRRCSFQKILKDLGNGKIDKKSESSCSQG